MASQLQTHTRSISLPSRLNPTNFESKLQKIKSCQIVSAIFPSEEIQSGLVGLAELYNSVQFSTVSEDEKLIEESLSGSVQLLDSCSVIRELLQMMKENIHALQSALRRKGILLEYSAVQNDVAAYFCCRKRMNKLVAKSLKKLKSLENIPGNILNGELTGATVAVFKSILVFLSGPPAASRWSLVSKMMAGKSAGENDGGRVVGSVEFALRSLHGKMRSSSNGGVTAVDVQLVQKGLQKVDAVIEGFEGGLERLFRQLIQNRVALLNIITDN
ncbi:hypothetical protein ACP275_03G084100 [Erythranthe tilingii]